MIKPEHQIIINSFVARVKATKFTSKKQLTEFLDTLVKDLGITTTTALQTKDLQAQKRKDAAAKRRKFKQDVRAIWCQRHLGVGNMVKVDNVKTVYTVSGIHADTATVISDTGSNGEISHHIIAKIRIDGDWHDIYKLASGGL